ncbi:MAG: YitT family protein [Saccharofermentanales bacterium]|jgi:uncharacterized membrane-anchored protein YitT (DUF2179 family)
MSCEGKEDGSPRRACGAWHPCPGNGTISEQKKPSYAPDYKRKGYTRKRRIKNFLLLNLGVLILAGGIHFFKYPNNFALGGVSGFSVVLGAVIPWATPATIALVVNLALLILAGVLLGKTFTGKTIYASCLLSVLLVVLERVVPMHASVSGEAFLELCLAMALSAIGSAILFNLHASSGGTDIVALLIQKYTSADIAKALLLSDFAVGMATFFIFDVRTGLFSVFGIAVKGFIVDALIDRFNRVKCFTIITSKPDEIAAFVCDFLQRSCTRMEAEGVYTGQERHVFLCVVDLRQAKILRDVVKDIDPNAFIMVNASSEVSGRGFRSSF